MQTLVSYDQLIEKFRDNGYCRSKNAKTNISVVLVVVVVLIVLVMLVVLAVLVVYILAAVWLLNWL